MEAKYENMSERNEGESEGDSKGDVRNGECNQSTVLGQSGDAGASSPGRDALPQEVNFYF